MKIAHLILTHKNPAQLERLLRAMEHPAFHFYIHIDRKTDIAPFLYLASNRNVHFIRQRTKIYWAGYGTIQATLNGFEEILPKGYDYINVISGQDFPIKPASQIYQYLSERKGTEFMTHESIDSEWPEAAVRVQRYHLINWKIPGKHRLEVLANKILPARKFPLDFKLVGRANWFTITPAAAQYIQDFLKKHPGVIRFFKLSWGADELIFSTILYNSPFRKHMAPNLIYVDWTGKTDGHPNILTRKDFTKLQQSEKLFARKLDMEVDAALFDMLEEHIAAPRLVTGQ